MLRREPFRLLFPLGVALGWIGVLPWLLFGGGLIRQWMGVYHALTMTQGFLLAAAAGFLATMVPRRTGSAPASAIEIAVFAIGPTLVPALLAVGQLALAEIAFVLTLLAIAQFGARRLFGASRAMPPSFVMLPFGVVCAIAGAALLIASTRNALMLAPGRSLPAEGLLYWIVLALAPKL
jgi:uncharacterized protein involved in response to NO